MKYLSELKAEIERFNKIEKKLNELGLKIKEISGYSDRQWYYISIAEEGSATPLLSTESLDEFILSAEAFIKGYEFKQGKK